MYQSINIGGLKIKLSFYRKVVYQDFLLHGIQGCESIF